MVEKEGRETGPRRRSGPQAGNIMVNVYLAVALCDCISSSKTLMELLTGKASRKLVYEDDLDVNEARRKREIQ